LVQVAVPSVVVPPTVAFQAGGELPLVPAPLTRCTLLLESINWA
jgi:hypothetical protein